MECSSVLQITFNFIQYITYICIHECYKPETFYCSSYIYHWARITETVIPYLENYILSEPWVFAYFFFFIYIKENNMQWPLTHPVFDIFYLKIYKASYVKSWWITFSSTNKKTLTVHNTQPFIYNVHYTMHIVRICTNLNSDWSAYLDC